MPLPCVLPFVVCVLLPISPALLCVDFAGWSSRRPSQLHGAISPRGTALARGTADTGPRHQASRVATETLSLAPQTRSHTQPLFRIAPQTCAALGNLAVNHSVNQKAIAGEGIIPLCVSLLREWERASSQFILQALGLLMSLGTVLLFLQLLLLSMLLKLL